MLITQKITGMVPMYCLLLYRVLFASDIELYQNKFLQYVIQVKIFICTKSNLLAVFESTYL